MPTGRQRIASEELVQRFYDYMNAREGYIKSASQAEAIIRKFAEKLVEELKPFVNASQDIVQVTKHYEDAIVNTITNYAHPTWWDKLNSPSVRIRREVKARIKSTAAAQGLRVLGVLELPLDCPKCASEGRHSNSLYLVRIAPQTPASEDEHWHSVVCSYGHYLNTLAMGYQDALGELVKDALKAEAKGEEVLGIAYKTDAETALRYLCAMDFSYEYTTLGSLLEEIELKLSGRTAATDKLVASLEKVLNFVHGRGALLDLIFGSEAAKEWRRKEQRRVLGRLLAKALLLASSRL